MTNHTPRLVSACALTVPTPCLGQRSAGELPVVLAPFKDILYLRVKKVSCNEL